jgi:uncharacterized protein (DUF924 family)
MSSSEAKPEIATRVLDFWFGAGMRGFKEPSKDRKELWFGSSAETDAKITAKFGDDVEAALDGDRNKLRGHGATGNLAFVILLDQFSRNIFRGSGKAFTGDALALGVAADYFEDEELHMDARKNLSVWQRTFLYMPFMHAENISALDKSLASTEELRVECVEAASAGDEDAARSCKGIEEVARFGQKHRAIIEKYGRYPHRNEALGRMSTPAEIQYLVDGDRFGQ